MSRRIAFFVLAASAALIATPASADRECFEQSCQHAGGGRAAGVGRAAARRRRQRGAEASAAVRRSSLRPRRCLRWWRPAPLGRRCRRCAARRAQAPADESRRAARAVAARASADVSAPSDAGARATRRRAVGLCSLRRCAVSSPDPALHGERSRAAPRPAAIVVVGSRRGV